MLDACFPFGPSVTSKDTLWPSCSDLNPEALIAEKCANRSSPPWSGVMKSKPFASLNHFTVPVAIKPLLSPQRRTIDAVDSSRVAWTAPCRQIGKKNCGKFRAAVQGKRPETRVTEDKSHSRRERMQPPACLGVGGKSCAPALDSPDGGSRAQAPCFYWPPLCAVHRPHLRAHGHAEGRLLQVLLDPG
jgi:hypothetical protein